MKKNDVIELNITDVTLEGSGVGRYENMAVFVPFSAVGDKLEVKILKVKTKYAFGKILKIIKPSTDRITETCDVYSRCGGCVFRHLDYGAELKLKENVVKNNFLRIAGLEPEFECIVGLSPNHYRNKAQYPVEIADGEVKVGFFSPRSHRVNDCERCLLQSESFGLAVKELKKFIIDFNISAYDEGTKKGLIRHLYIRKGAVTGETMVCLVINGDSLPESKEFVKRMQSVFGEDLKSVLLNINKKDTNVILGDEIVTLYGKDYIADILCGVKVNISPLSFYQVNHAVAEKLYEKAAEYADTKGKTVLDLYCGAGTIGLSMAKNAKKIVGVEVVPEAVENAKENAKNNGFNNTEFICGDAKIAAQKLKEQNVSPDVVILDPPRKGCEEELLQIVANDFCPERVVYVSCDSATLARDCKIFNSMGYKTEKVSVFDMFPRTGHVETVALLGRQKVKEHIYIDVNIADLPKTTRTTATYPEIKAYIKDKYGLCVSSLNIAQIKEKHGFEKRENYNKGKEGHRVPKCPPEKEKAIEEAFKHFGML
jgi:23S rRNA (uracil1939-C5)-methyltransferase